MNSLLKVLKGNSTDTPYLIQDKTIKKFECIKYNETFKIYKKLVEWGLCKLTIDYIIDVKHENIINNKYDKVPEILVLPVAVCPPVTVPVKDGKLVQR